MLGWMTPRWNRTDVLAGLGGGVLVLGAGVGATFESGFWHEGSAGRWATLVAFAAPPMLIALATFAAIAFRRPWIAAGMSIASTFWIVATTASFVHTLEMFGAW
jgi:hypothetical protein